MDQENLPGHGSCQEIGNSDDSACLIQTFQDSGQGLVKSPFLGD